jgi:hypothetical protein
MMETTASLSVAHPIVFLLLALAIGAYAGMTLMACLVAAGRADRALERDAAHIDVPNCCAYGHNFDCNQGDDCPLRVRG